MKHEGGPVGCPLSGQLWIIRGLRRPKPAGVAGVNGSADSARNVADGRRLATAAQPLLSVLSPPRCRSLPAVVAAERAPVWLQGHGPHVAAGPLAALRVGSAPPRPVFLVRQVRVEREANTVRRLTLRFRCLS